MGSVQPISLYPESPLQREQIVEHAREQDQELSEYCLEATRQRIIREQQGVTGTGLDLAAQIQSLADDVSGDIASVTDPEMPSELVYLVGLWELVSSEYPNEERAEALEQAPAILARQITALRDHGGDEL